MLLNAFENLETFDVSVFKSHSIDLLFSLLWSFIMEFMDRNWNVKSSWPGSIFAWPSIDFYLAWNEQATHHRAFVLFLRATKTESVFRFMFTVHWIQLAISFLLMSPFSLCEPFATKCSDVCDILFVFRLSTYPISQPVRRTLQSKSRLSGKWTRHFIYFVLHNFSSDAIVFINIQSDAVKTFFHLKQTQWKRNNIQRRK